MSITYACDWCGKQDWIYGRVDPANGYPKMFVCTRCYDRIDEFQRETREKLSKPGDEQDARENPREGV